MGLLMDPTGVQRLIKQHNLPPGWKFHFYNCLAHVVPVFVQIAAMLSRAIDVQFHHGLWAAAIHLGWGIFVSNGTLVLDHIYAAMHPSAWHVMWATAIFSEAILAPLVL